MTPALYGRSPPTCSMAGATTSTASRTSCARTTNWFAAKPQGCWESRWPACARRRPNTGAQFLPPPSRQKPFPDADAVAAAQRLERLAEGIGALEALIQQQPVPENDRVTQRFRQEAPTLKTLIHHDEQLVGQCDLLRSMVNRQDERLDTREAARSGGRIGSHSSHPAKSGSCPARPCTIGWSAAPCPENSSP